jgi:hypothetical protein
LPHDGLDALLELEAAARIVLPILEDLVTVHPIETNMRDAVESLA